MDPRHVWKLERKGPCGIDCFPAGHYSRQPPGSRCRGPQSAICDCLCTSTCTGICSHARVSCASPSARTRRSCRPIKTTRDIRPLGLQKRARPKARLGPGLGISYMCVCLCACRRWQSRRWLARKPRSPSHQAMSRLGDALLNSWAERTRDSRSTLGIRRRQKYLTTPPCTGFLDPVRQGAPYTGTAVRCTPVGAMLLCCSKQRHFSLLCCGICPSCCPTWPVAPPPFNHGEEARTCQWRQQ